jgi:hypothetical protein
LLRGSYVFRFGIIVLHDRTLTLFKRAKNGFGTQTKRICCTRKEEISERCTFFIYWRFTNMRPDRYPTGLITSY